MAYNERVYRENKRWLDSHKDFHCTDCGLKYPPWNMEFDHRPEEDKSFTIGNGRQYGRESILKEMRKCDLVCVLCHGDRTQRRLDCASRLA